MDTQLPAYQASIITFVLDSTGKYKFCNALLSCTPIELLQLLVKGTAAATAAAHEQLALQQKELSFTVGTPCGMHPVLSATIAGDQPRLFVFSG